MTSSQMTAPAPIVAGPAQWTAPLPAARVDLTIVLPLRETTPSLTDTLDRMCRALWAQCITFEMVVVSTGAADDVLSAMPDARQVVADPYSADAIWEIGFSAGSGQWIGLLDLDETSDIDAYEFIEHLHQAREGAGLFV
jgi:hypothetical protein